MARRHRRVVVVVVVVVDHKSLEVRDRLDQSSRGVFCQRAIDEMTDSCRLGALPLFTSACAANESRAQKMEEYVLGGLWIGSNLPEQKYATSSSDQRLRVGSIASDVFPRPRLPRNQQEFA